MHNGSVFSGFIMFCNGVYLDESQLNRLFQIQSNPHYKNFSLLLQKPTAWSDRMKTDAIAQKKLRLRLLEPIPDAFIDRDCSEFLEFRKVCQSTEAIWLIGEKISIVYIMIALHHKHGWLQLPVDELLSLLNTSPIPCPCP